MLHPNTIFRAELIVNAGFIILNKTIPFAQVTIKVLGDIGYIL